jgi:hypothetical protein
MLVPACLYWDTWCRTGVEAGGHYFTPTSLSPCYCMLLSSMSIPSERHVAYNLGLMAPLQCLPAYPTTVLLCSTC